MFFFVIDKNLLVNKGNKKFHFELRRICCTTCACGHSCFKINIDKTICSAGVSLQGVVCGVITTTATKPIRLNTIQLDNKDGD